VLTLCIAKYLILIILLLFSLIAALFSGTVIFGSLWPCPGSFNVFLPMSPPPLERMIEVGWMVFIFCDRLLSPVRT